MKILVFENEFKEIEGAFKGLKIILDDKVDYEVKKSSQDLGDFEKLYSYDVVFVDLDLVPTSKMTGYDILKEIKDSSNVQKPVVIVITGHSTAKEELQRRGVEMFSILEKPFGMNELENIIKPLLSAP